MRHPPSLKLRRTAASAGSPEKGERKGGAGSVTGAAGEREAFVRPSRRPPMPHATPAHKSFSDRASLYQEITDKIIAELEQGRVPWVQPWTVLLPRSVFRVM